MGQLVYSSTTQTLLREKQIIYTNDNIIKSDRDPCQYRLIRLSNGLEVLIISDENSKKAAVSMDVGAGNFDDPDTIPGLAHLTEHMLFLGTEQFPNENDYSNFMSRHNGYSNAFTTEEQTNFHFEIGCDDLYDALIRFACLFIKPLFSSDGVERELESINSENSKNMASDSWRINQVEKYLSSRGHPFHHFGTGNRKTLEIPGIRTKVYEFFKKNYKMNRMKMVIYSRNSVDSLQRTVEDLFSQVTDEPPSASPPPSAHRPFHQEHLNRVIYAQTLRSRQSLIITWQLEKGSSDVVLKCMDYYIHLIGHESSGSIFAELKKKAWATKIVATTNESIRYDYFFLKLRIELSQEGLRNWRKIFRIVKQYLELLNQLGPQKLIWDEIREMEMLNFRFAEKGTLSRFVTIHAQKLQRKYPIENILLHSKMNEKFEPEILKLALSQLLNTKSMRVIITAKNKPPGTVQLEPWYKTPFSVDQLPLDEIVAKELDSIIENLHLPKPNHFIPKALIAKGLERQQSHADDSVKMSLMKPQLVYADSQIRFWYKKFEIFSMPKGSIRIHVRSKIMNSNVKNAVMLHLFTTILKETLNELTFDAKLAGLFWSVSETTDGLALCFHGYSENMFMLVNLVLEKLGSLDSVSQKLPEFSLNARSKSLNHKFRGFNLKTNTCSKGDTSESDFERPYDHKMTKNQRQETNERKFQIISKKYLDNLESLMHEPPFIIAYNYGLGLRRSQHWWPNEKINVLRDPIGRPTLQDIFTFKDKFFSQTKIDILYHGDLSASESFKLIQMSIDPKIMFSTDYFASEILNDGTSEKNALFYPPHQTFKLSPVPVPDSNCAVQLLLQTGDGRKSRCLSFLFVQIFKEPFFYELRTKKQLGYVVNCHTTSVGTRTSISFLVQSTQMPHMIEDAIELFIDDTLDKLKKMPDSVFMSHLQSISQRLKTNPLKLVAETNKYWNQILTQQFDFDRSLEDAEIIDNLTREDLDVFIKKMILRNSPMRSKLVIHIWSRKSLAQQVEHFNERNINPDARSIIFADPRKLVEFLKLNYTKETKLMDLDDIGDDQEIFSSPNEPLMY